MEKELWGEYWSTQDTPLHASTDELFYSLMSREILFHTGSPDGKKVLEIGCGDGSLYGQYAKHCKSYTGVDFSASLLDKYRSSYPEVELVQSDALTYARESNQTFDIIFSYGVLQYLGLNELKDLFMLQKKMLNPGGVCVHFGLPVRELSDPFHKGKGSVLAVGKNSHRGLLQQIKSRFFNKIGNWHSMDELYAISVSAGFDTKVCANMSYFYRINLIQKTET